MNMATFFKFVVRGTDVAVVLPKFQLSVFDIDKNTNLAQECGCRYRGRLADVSAMYRRFQVDVSPPELVPPCRCPSGVQSVPQLPSE